MLWWCSQVADISTRKIYNIKLFGFECCWTHTQTYPTFFLHFKTYPGIWTSSKPGQLHYEMIYGPRYNCHTTIVLIKLYGPMHPPALPAPLRFPNCESCWHRCLWTGTLRCPHYLVSAGWLAAGGLLADPECSKPDLVEKMKFPDFVYRHYTVIDSIFC